MVAMTGAFGKVGCGVFVLCLVNFLINKRL